MPRRTTAYLPEDEWEGLRVPYTVVQIASSPHLPLGIPAIELARDETYRIGGKARGEIVSRYDPWGNVHSGDYMLTISITGADRHKGYRYELEGLKGGYSESFIVNERPTFTQDLNLHRVRRLAWRHNSMQQATLVEWYLNGPRDLRIYRRSVVRKVTSRYKKQLIGSDRTYPASGSRQEYHNGGALIEWDNRCCVIQQVPLECGPAWSENIGIEYRAEWGGLPTPDEREAISEIISFVIGRRLMRVGTTIFTKAGRVIEEESVNPWGSNALVVCQLPADLPPIGLGPFAENVNLELVLQRLIPAYLSAREELGLRDALWRYWLAREMRVPQITLPTMGAGLDNIADMWIKSRRSKTTGVYLPAKQWRKITGEIFPTIRAQLEDIKGQDSIMNKLDEAFKLSGVNEKRRVLLGELMLHTGDVEERAFKARNQHAHGSRSDDNDDMGHHMNAYDTLFNRVILKILGYDGTYIDRSARGFPETPLDQPLAGSAAEG